MQIVISITFFFRYRFDQPLVSDGQNCGNILAGVAPFALERGMIPAAGDTTDVRIRMLNTGGVAVASIQTPDGEVNYAGDARIDGVPNSAAPVMIDFADVAGSSCGDLLPTGAAVDVIDGIDVSCVDNGMPVVVVRAEALGKRGDEAPQALEADAALKTRIESIRRQAGAMMHLGDVREKTVPKISLISDATAGGTLSTRTFIPHRVHQAIGVLGAASVAAACLIPESVAAPIVVEPPPGAPLEIEHPTGRFSVDILLERDQDRYVVRRSALLRTARKLMDGHVFVPASLKENDRARH